jgi:hypothetical protein
MHIKDTQKCIKREGEHGGNIMNLHLKMEK